MGAKLLWLHTGGGRYVPKRRPLEDRNVLATGWRGCKMRPLSLLKKEFSI